MKKIEKIFWPIFAFVSPVILILNYFWDNWYAFFDSWSVAMTFGLCGYTYFLLVVMMAARVKYFDRLFGHDTVMVFHGYMALAGIVCIIIHRQMKLIQYADESLQMRLGILASFIFAVITLLTLLLMVPNLLHRIGFIDRLRIFINKKAKLNYKVLKTLHNFTILAIIIASIHVLLASSTQENYLRIGFVFIYFILAVSFYIYHKIIRLLLTSRNEFSVSRVSSLNDQITEIEMELPYSRITGHKPGQFAFFRIKSSLTGFEEHPFTISSPAGKDKKTLSFTAKNLGDYTEKLNKLKTGTKVLVDGYYGIFTPVLGKTPYLFVAGGIGITPFLSVLKSWGKENINAPVILIWTVQKMLDLIEHEYLSNLAVKCPNFLYFPIVTRDEQWTGLKERINKETLEKTAGDFITKEIQVYFCGPEKMRIGIIKLLKEFNVPQKNIHFERFSL